MPLSIKSDEADRLARRLAQETGESLTEAVTGALRMRLDHVGRQRRGVADRLMAISQASSVRPRLDERSDDQIVGYDEHGLPS
jgi:antitoxin VapB